MALYISNSEIEQLAQILVTRTGEPLEKVMLSALMEKLQHTPRSEEERKTLAEDLLAIGRHCASLPVLDNRSADEILGYDENGLPS